MNFFKKLFSKQSTNQSAKSIHVQENNLPERRKQSLRVCSSAGFKPARSLPTSWDLKLRPSLEIAGRLHAIKALVLWLMVSAEHLEDEKILQFVEKNTLKNYMSEDEIAIFQSERDNDELRNSIGWKFENAWPLAWYFGYDEPDHLGHMMPGEEMEEILMNYTCSLEETMEEWTNKQTTKSEEEVAQKEDLFYCLHNAVRSAQLGRNTVPNGFDPIGNGGVIHERRHALTWMLSEHVKWEDTELAT